MKKLALVALMSALSVAAISSQASAADAPVLAKVLICQNRLALASIPTCGGVRPGCTASVTANGKTTEYPVVRKKNTDGSLTYTSKTTARRACTIEIGPLRYGVRPVTRATCAKALRGAKCQILEVDGTPTATPTSTPTP